MIADFELLQTPWRAAAGALHASLRAAAEQVEDRSRAARTVRAALAAFGARLAARLPVDVRGDAVEVLAAYGIHVSARTAREVVRTLARHTVIVVAGSRHMHSRIRLASAYRAAVALAETRRITPQVFEPGSSLLGDPVQLSLPFDAAPRVCDPSRDSSSPAYRGTRVPGDNTQDVPTYSVWIRDLPNRPRIRDAAQLLVDHGARVDPALARPAQVRALLAAAGRPADHRTVAALGRAVAWLADRGLLAAGSLAPAARPHPDLVILGADPRPTADPCSEAMQAHLRRRGVWNPSALGDLEARTVAAALWSRPIEGERLTLHELRARAGLPARAVAGYPELVDEIAASTRGRTTLAAGRLEDASALGFWIRWRAGKHPLQADPRLARPARCDVAGAPAGSADAPGGPRRDRERVRLGLPGRGRPTSEGHDLGAARRRLPVDPPVPPVGGPRRGRPAGGHRVPRGSVEHPPHAGRRAGGIAPPPAQP